MKRWILLVAMSVALLGGAVGLWASEKAEDKKGKGEKVTLSQCPQAVQDTLKKEAGDNKIEKVKKETKDGKTVYQGEATIDGKEVEIKVAEDGKLISKETEADDKDAKDQEGEHEDQNND